MRLHRRLPAHATPLGKSLRLHLERLEDRCVPASGLVLGLGFEEGAGTVTVDNSGQGNHGLLSGPAWTTQGKFGSALSFDGIDDWVTVADANSLDLTTGVTLEAWVKPSELSGYPSVLVKEASNPVGLCYQLYANNGSPEPGFYIYTSSDRMSHGNAPLPVDAWSHLAATYDGAMMRIFVNGIEVGSFAESTSITTSTNPFRIGGDAPFGEHF